MYKRSLGNFGLTCVLVGSGADPGGGSRGPMTPPGPQRGGPGPLFQNEENSIYYLQLIKLLCYFPYPYLQKYILKILIDLQIDLGEKQKHIYLLCELHKITSRKYEGMFLLEKKWKNSVKMFYLLSCYNASEQLSGHQISKCSKPQTPSCIWLASLAVASGNFGPVN